MTDNELNNDSTNIVQNGSCAVHCVQSRKVIAEHVHMYFAMMICRLSFEQSWVRGLRVLLCCWMRNRRRGVFLGGIVSPTEKIKVQRPLPSILSVSQGGRRATFLFRNLRQSASQNLSEKNVAVLTAPSFLERFCEADWRNSETK